MYYNLISSMTKSGVISDAQAFINATGITNSTQISAVNTLVNDLKTYGIWSKMKAIYPMVGGTATTHKFNLKDPRDLDAAFRLVFNGGWTHSGTGALPNGTTAYADTKLIPSSILTQNSTHLSYYSRTDISGVQTEIGIFIAAPDRISISLRYNGGLYSDQYNFNTGRVGITNSSSTGFYISSRTNSNTHKAYKNNAQIGTTNTGVPGNLSLLNASIYLGTPNRTTEPLFAFSTKECAFATIGDGLTDTESANFYTAVQNFNTTLARQV